MSFKHPPINHDEPTFFGLLAELNKSDLAFSYMLFKKATLEDIVRNCKETAEFEKKENSFPDYDWSVHDSYLENIEEFIETFPE